MKSRVKVRTADLLAAVKQRRAEAERKHAQRVAASEKARVAYQKRVVEALAKALADAEAGKLPEHIGYQECLRVPVGFKPVDDPAEFEPRDLDRLIATLEIAAEDTISVSADDAARYLG